MDTESADGLEVSVTLPPALAEWLDERAETLGVDRDEVLVQLLSTYQTTDDFEETTVDFDGVAALEGHITDEQLDRIERRIDSLESELDDSVEDLRNRVLQLRDALEECAPVDHDHEELSRLLERVDEFDDDLGQLDTELAGLTEEIDAVTERLDDAETKLDRLARVVVALRKRTLSSESPSDDEEHLERLRRTANQLGVAAAKCTTCDETVRIGLLTEPACPHCNTPVRDVERPDSFLWQRLEDGLRTPLLVSLEPPQLEAGDE